MVKTSDIKKPETWELYRGEDGGRGLWLVKITGRADSAVCVCVWAQIIDSVCGYLEACETLSNLTAHNKALQLLR